MQEYATLRAYITVQSVLLKTIANLNNKCKHIFIPMKSSEMIILQRAIIS